MTERPSQPARRLLFVLVGLLALAQIVWIASTWEGMGYTKDEGYYFSAARDNFGWYGFLVSSTLRGEPAAAFSQNAVDRYWRNNHEHPPFCKTVQGLHHHVFHQWLPILNYGNSHRAAAITWTLILIAFMVFLGSEWLSPGWAVCTVLLLFTMPRVFFHSHLNTFDIPVVAVWVATAYAFRRGMQNPRWAWLTGLLLGVGLATKNNAYFLPVLFFIMYLASAHWRSFRQSLWRLPAHIRQANKPKLALLLLLVLAPLLTGLVAFPHLAAVLLVCLILANVWLAWVCLVRPEKIPVHIAPILPPLLTAPLVFVALWPWIWHDTWGRLAVYFNRHLNPPAWETYYLDKIIVNPPPFDWHYPFVMSAFTIPALLLLVFVLGLGVMTVRGLSALKRARLRDAAMQPPAAPLLGQWERPAEPRVITPRWDLLFLLVNFILPVLVIANPKTPIYGGTKHYMTALPYFVIICAIGLRWLTGNLAAQWTLKARGRAALAAVLVLVVMMPGLLGIRHTHPYTLSYYNELMGGSIAAPEVGMQRTFWAQTTQGVLEHLNRVVPRNGTVYFNNTPGTSINAYQRDGYLRKDIRAVRLQDLARADYAVMSNWKFYADRIPGSIYHIRQEFGAGFAEAWADIDGMPLVEVFRNVKKLGPSPSGMSD